MSKNNYWTKKELDRLDRQLQSALNHVEKHNHEMGEVCEEIKEIKTNQQWIMRLIWIVMTASVGGLLGTLFQLIV